MSQYITRRNLALAGVSMGITAIGFYSYPRKHHFTHQTAKPAWWRKAHPEMFEVSTPGNDKQWRSSTHILLSEEECERRLKSGEESVNVPRQGSPIVRWESNLLGSNSPCEDRFVVDLISKSHLVELRESMEKGFWSKWGEITKRWKGEKDTPDVVDGGNGSDDFLFVSVMDGHGWGGGWEISSLLQKTLHGCLSFGLGGVGNAESEDKLGKEIRIKRMMRDVFTALDQDIQKGVLSLLNPVGQPVGRILPNPPPSQIAMTNLESPGSCAITAMVDVADNKVYVANLGDCRAVAGWYDPYEKAWRCDVLSSDHMVDNPDEEKRSISEHPESEKDDVICSIRFGKRTLGSNEITRAFGNTYYKRPAEDSKKLGEAFDISYPELKREVKTPPYISNIPDVVVRDLKPASGEQLRFVILASDGLRDNISSEEAALLVAAHLTKDLPTTISKEDATKIIPFIQGIDQSRPFPAKAIPGAQNYSAVGDWTLKDDNAATHVMRNALGRGDPLLRRRIMSMKDGIARSFRDDTTIVVVTFATEA